MDFDEGFFLSFCDVADIQLPHDRAIIMLHFVLHYLWILYLDLV